MGYNLLINGVYRGYNPFTNHLLTSWNIQVDKGGGKKYLPPFSSVSSFHSFPCFFSDLCTLYSFLSLWKFVLLLYPDAQYLAYLPTFTINLQ